MAPPAYTVGPNDAYYLQVLRDPAFRRFIDRLVPPPPEPQPANQDTSNPVTDDYAGNDGNSGDDAPTPAMEVARNESESGDEGDSDNGAESDTATVSVPGQRRKTIRQRTPKPPIDYGEIDYTHLHDPSTMLRPHKPLPETWHASFEDLVKFYDTFGRENGVAFRKCKWKHNIGGNRYKLELRCIRSGKRKELTERKRPNAQSQKIECPYGFYAVAEDYTNPEKSRWRIVHMGQQKSLLHNHSPYESIYSVPKYRSEWKTDDIRARVLELSQRSANGAKQILKQLQEEYPGIQLSAQDVRNMWNRYVEQSGPTPARTNAKTNGNATNAQKQRRKKKETTRAAQSSSDQPIQQHNQNAIHANGAPTQSNMMLTQAQQNALHADEQHQHAMVSTQTMMPPYNYHQPFHNPQDTQPPDHTAMRNTHPFHSSAHLQQGSWLPPNQGFSERFP